MLTGRKRNSSLDRLRRDLPQEFTIQILDGQQDHQKDRLDRLRQQVEGGITATRQRVGQAVQRFGKRVEGE